MKNKELKIWALIAPFVGAFGLLEKSTATSFDQNEWESIGAVGVGLRVGFAMLRNKHFRAWIRDVLDSFEKNEGDATP